MDVVEKNNIKSLLIKNILRIPLVNNYTIVSFFSAWSPSRKYGNFGAEYLNDSIKSRILFYVEELKPNIKNLKEHKPALDYVNQFLDRETIRYYKDGTGLITIIELEGEGNLKDFLKVCMDPSRYLSETVGKELLNLINQFEENFNNSNINLIFSFAYSFITAPRKIHNVNQLQISYSNEKNKKNAIVEILDFCKCPDLSFDEMEKETNNYIEGRKANMMYENLCRINDSFNRRVALVHGSDKTTVRTMHNWFLENVFNR